MTMIFKNEHHLRLDAIFQNQNFGKNLLAEKTFMADQGNVYGWVNEWVRRFSATISLSSKAQSFIANLVFLMQHPEN